MTTWNNFFIARQATDDNKIRRMRVVCRINKATKTLRICNIYCFSTGKIVMANVALDVTLYVYCLSRSAQISLYFMMLSYFCTFIKYLGVRQRLL